MKKLLLCLSALILLLPLCRTAALADAVAWDMEKADYNVWVSASDGVNLRAGPGTEYDKLLPEAIPTGTKLYVSYVSDRWGETQYNGQDGWIALSQTTTQAPASTASAQAGTPASAAPTQAPAPTASAAASTPPAAQSAAPSVSSPAVSASTTDVVTPASSGSVNLLVVGLLVAVIVVLAVVLIVVLRKKRGDK